MCIVNLLVSCFKKKFFLKHCATILLVCFFLCVTLLPGCRKIISNSIPQIKQNDLRRLSYDRPNIVLILADDVGYEVPRYTGGQSYNTPNINMLAANSLQFTQCQTAPNCSPSRVMLLTGKYNFRNYTNWGVLDPSQYTIANMLHDAGYKTCVSGKWQLNGGDAAIRNFGFDSYRVFLPYTPANMKAESDENWYRYKNPHIYENGAYLPDSATLNKYADDMFAEYISNFIDSNLTNPFFIYFSLSLCHPPFTPTPDDSLYATWTPESQYSAPRFFASMVNYMDKKVGQIVNKINEAGIAENTIILFLGDNGTSNEITSKFQGKFVTGGKGTTKQYGTHVPFIFNWQSHITPGTQSNTPISLPDFMPTLAELADINLPAEYGIIDGVNFYTPEPGVQDTIRDELFCYWKPQVKSKTKRWAQTTAYKLYDSTQYSKFYNLIKDTSELHPITSRRITPEETIIKQQLQQLLDRMQ